MPQGTARVEFRRGVGLVPPCEGWVCSHTQFPTWPWSPGSPLSLTSQICEKCDYEHSKRDLRYWITKSLSGWLSFPSHLSWDNGTFHTAGTLDGPCLEPASVCSISFHKHPDTEPVVCRSPGAQEERRPGVGGWEGQEDWPSRQLITPRLSEGAAGAGCLWTGSKAAASLLWHQMLFSILLFVLRRNEWAVSLELEFRASFAIILGGIESAISSSWLAPSGCICSQPT